ncbi:capsular polysaccharide biosynthesis protein [Mycobacterium frederiksbergense]|uniref:Capsular polysaccharide biosynthesis protein n=1 Tax=Mycolicibacterium frederiksbergense TaxID=117567 RepID=A0ABT6L1X1_9MYCO|nr:protein tyrosine kinase [Mycolicibacterium frederiksbergense]MDH6196217.1 capsular polysaccharide biosynthesis protein [Mycolicibacterium frederiksbergense]
MASRPPHRTYPARFETIAEGDEKVTLKAFIEAVKRYRSTYFVVAGVIFVCLITPILLSPTRYVSSTRLMVTIEGSTTAAAYQIEEVANRRVHSYIALLTSGVVTQRVVDKLGLSMTSSELAQKISATNVPPKTSLIDVEVTDESVERAQLIANTVASEFIAFADAIETPTGEDNQKIHTTVVSTASEGHEKQFERVLLGVLAALTALALGAVAVWIRAMRERSVPRAEQHTAGPDMESGESTHHARHAASGAVEATDQN